MTKRKKNVLFCFVALVIGFLLYVIYRPGTYIGSVLNEVDFINRLRQNYSFYASDLYKFYLPDFLWGFALGCGFIAIYNPAIKGIILCSASSFLCGCLWELLQYSEAIKGTGDIHDIIMYFFASILCIIINLKEK